MTHRVARGWQLLMIWCLLWGSMPFAEQAAARNSRPPRSYYVDASMTCNTSETTLTSLNNYYVYTPSLLGKQYQVKTTKVGTADTPSDVVIEDIALQLYLGKPQKISALGITASVIKIFPNQHLVLKVWACPNDQPVVQESLPLLSAGGIHTCTNVTGVLQCWGSNGSGQLGLGFPAPGTYYSSTGTPSTTVPPLFGITAISGSFSTCIANKSGEVYCWGHGMIPQGGDGIYYEIVSSPKLVEGFPGPVVDVSVYGDHACAVLGSGLVHCWGEDTNGELGIGEKSFGLTKPSYPVIGLTGVVSVATGYRASCALKSDGTVWCWGDNDNGLLGVDETVMEESSVPVQVLGLPSTSELVMGSYHACVIADGGVWCWGMNGYGQLGTGSVAAGSSWNQPSFPPQQVSNLTAVQTLSAGSAHTCVVQTSGEVMCWGSNTMCALGIGAEGGVYPEPQAVTVKDTAGSLRLSAGNKHTCVLLKDKTTIKCWGANVHGQLGLGTVPQGSSYDIVGKVKAGLKTDENGVPYYVCGE